MSPPPLARDVEVEEARATSSSMASSLRPVRLWVEPRRLRVVGEATIGGIGRDWGGGWGHPPAAPFLEPPECCCCCCCCCGPSPFG